MNEEELGYCKLCGTVRVGRVPVGPGEPEAGVRRPSVWRPSEGSDGDDVASDLTCDRPGHRYSHCDCGPFIDEPLDITHGDTCDCAECDGGAWEDDGGAVYGRYDDSVYRDHFNDVASAVREHNNLLPDIDYDIPDYDINNDRESGDSG